jgi:hypothetical protein
MNAIRLDRIALRATPAFQQADQLGTQAVTSLGRNVVQGKEFIIDCTLCVLDRSTQVTRQAVSGTPVLAVGSIGGLPLGGRRPQWPALAFQVATICVRCARLRASRSMRVVR